MKTNSVNNVIVVKFLMKTNSIIMLLIVENLMKTNSLIIGCSLIAKTM